MALTFITEEHIDKTIDSYYESEKKFFADKERLANDQAAFSALLTDDSYDLLSDDEYELLWFIATVVHATVMENHGSIGACSQEDIEVLEEQNWTILEEVVTGSFHDRITKFYNSYSQEDLLAFVEDSLESDEDIEVSPAGRELIFVSCKTLIDVLILKS